VWRRDVPLRHHPPGVFQRPGDGAEKGRLRAQWDELFKVIHSEKLGQVADEFDRIHSVQRALRVGALNEIIPPATLRPFLIRAVERAVVKEVESIAAEKLEAKAGGEVESISSGKSEAKPGVESAA